MFSIALLQRYRNITESETWAVTNVLVNNAHVHHEQAKEYNVML